MILTKTINSITSKEIGEVSETPIMNEQSFSILMEKLNELHLKNNDTDVSGLELIIQSINNFENKVLIKDKTSEEFYYEFIVSDGKQIIDQIVINYRESVYSNVSITISEKMIMISNNVIKVVYFYDGGFEVFFDYGDYHFRSPYLIIVDINKDTEKSKRFKTYYDLILSLFSLNYPIFAINGIAKLGSILRNVEPIKTTFNEVTELSVGNPNTISIVSGLAKHLLSSGENINVLECNSVGWIDRDNLD